MEDWARLWLEEQRKQGKKGLEIKKIGNHHYVYYSTTHWSQTAAHPDASIGACKAPPLV